MRWKDLMFNVLMGFGSLFGSNDCIAQNSIEASKLLVSLRMIGHEILLQSGDSLSRVLPIKKDDEVYRISFENEFEFNPDQLVTTVKNAIEKANLDVDFIVEMEDCVSSEIVYSFQMGKDEKSEIVPCRSRTQIKSCYHLVFTVLPNNKTLLNHSENQDIWMNQYGLLVVGFLVLIIFSIPAYRWKSRRRLNDSSYIIRLGDYQFDKRNTELLFENQRIELTSKEADLLLTLHNEVNKTIKREVILHRVWGDEGDYVGRTLDVFISKLRKKLESDPKLKIVNIRGVGYKLVVNE